MEKIGQFILSLKDADGAELLLHKTHWPELPFSLNDLSAKDILSNTIDARKKIRTKVPDWFEVPSLLYPRRICSEQCSSQKTAFIKADILERILKECQDKSIADLTSGLGVDVWAFSRISSRVLYNDMDQVLERCVRQNFSTLGLNNVDFSCVMVTPESLGDILKDHWQNPGIIFLDPARRDSSGKKVFLLEDCSPDVLTLMEGFKDHSDNVVMKISPMADISIVVQKLQKAGAPVKEVHVISTSGECKEILLWCSFSFTGKHSLIIHENDSTLQVKAGREKESIYTLEEGVESLLSNQPKYLFEPGKALTKAGLFNFISQNFQIVKAARSTHLYFAPEESVDALSKFGKVFRILELLPMGSKNLKDVGKRYPCAEVTSRNLPISSENLRKKLSVKASDSIHIFAFKTEFRKGKPEDILAVCQREFQQVDF